MDSKEKSEKSAIKNLIEISQKENFFDIGKSENELNAWGNRGLNRGGSKAKPLVVRPITASGKPRDCWKVDRSWRERLGIAVKKISLVAPKGDVFCVKPPVVCKVSSRKGSLVMEGEQRKIEKMQSNDINFNYRRKMVKYKILKKCLGERKRISLISFPKFIL